MNWAFDLERGRLRIFKNKAFDRFARKAGIDDAVLRAAVSEVERGLIDADLGGGVIKKRIARAGQGKSGGFRAVILYRRATRAFFVYGFAKSARSNVAPDELAALKELASVLLAYGDREISMAVKSGVLIEVTGDE